MCPEGVFLHLQNINLALLAHYNVKGRPLFSLAFIPSNPDHHRKSAIHILQFGKSGGGGVGGGLSFILTTINKHIDITASMKKGAIPDARLYQK